MLRRGRIRGWLSLRDVPRRLDEFKTSHVHVRRRRVLERDRVRDLPRRSVQPRGRRDDDIVYHVQRQRVLERPGMHRVPRRVNRHGRRDFMYLRHQPEMGRIRVRGLPLRIIQRWRQRDDDIVYHVQRQRVLERPGVRIVPRGLRRRRRIRDVVHVQ